MLDEVKRHPEGQQIAYPYLSWKYREIIRVHEKLYPESRIRAVSRLLMYFGMATMGSMCLVVFAMVMLR
jgi:hypothetical protein